MSTGKTISPQVCCCQTDHQYRRQWSEFFSWGCYKQTNPKIILSLLPSCPCSSNSRERCVGSEDKGYFDTWHTKQCHVSMGFPNRSSGSHSGSELKAKPDGSCFQKKEEPDMLDSRCFLVRFKRRHKLSNNKSLILPDIIHSVQS